MEAGLLCLLVNHHRHHLTGHELDFRRLPVRDQQDLRGLPQNPQVTSGTVGILDAQPIGDRVDAEVVVLSCHVPTQGLVTSRTMCWLGQQGVAGRSPDCVATGPKHEIDAMPGGCGVGGVLMAAYGAPQIAVEVLLDLNWHVEPAVAHSDVGRLSETSILEGMRSCSRARSASLQESSCFGSAGWRFLSSFQNCRQMDVLTVEVVVQ